MLAANKPDGWKPDATKEEVVPEEDLDRLGMIAECLMPETGGLKKLIEAYKVSISFLGLMILLVIIVSIAPCQQLVLLVQIIYESSCSIRTFDYYP